MKYSFNAGYNYLIKLNKGERLSEAIEQFARETKIEGAWIQGLGGALEATLGFYDLDAKEYQWKTFEGLREVLSLTGNIAFDEQGKIVYHLHGTFGDRDYRVVGGHVKDLVVGATLELFVQRTIRSTKRKTDPEVWLQTLDL
jgi:predicted DNA-binding protein with PD1-like motif